MSQQTSIEWTDHVWNFLRGCTKVSGGCKNCYAEKIAGRFSGDGLPYNGLATMQNGRARWTGEIAFDESALLAPLKRRKPTRYFVNSMSDLFHEKVKDEWLDKAFAVMALCPQHTFQILTKQADRMQKYCSGKDAYFSSRFRIADQLIKLGGADLVDWDCGTIDLPLPNVWLGVSVENQKAADERIPLLLETPAAVRWLSCEPLLERININHYLYTRYLHGGTHHETERIDWVIVGGESGIKSRPCHINWIRAVVAQCKLAKVSVFVKQLGAHVWMQNPNSNFDSEIRVYLKNKKGGDIAEFPEDLQIRECPAKPAN